MFNKLSSLKACAMAALCLCAVHEFNATVSAQPEPQVPAIQREFRGLWIATVGNSDWPSRKNLTPAQQKAELTAIFNKAAALNCNAIILQVRPMCDAFYKSPIEPWSEYLTGTMGKAPSPSYDPLSFAVTEAHKRGMELHAWFNPYRVRALASTTPAAATHVSKQHPELVRRYSKYLWLDPTEPATREYSLSVLRDVVSRYDIDGVHFDDYFYPYQDTDAKGEKIEFPDDASWTRYQAAGGKLSRSDWRRDNVNTFIKLVQQMIKQEKPWVKYGISPFGIWQPGYPKSIKGLNAYNVLYADSRKWLAQGWVDYLAPQLYWSIDSKGQSFPDLLEWWVAQNKSDRYVWPGVNLDLKVDNIASEIAAEMDLIRKEKASGSILWHARPIVSNRGKIADRLAKIYDQPALVPPLHWLNSTPPDAPKVEVKKGTSNLTVKWRPQGQSHVWQWVVQIKQDGKWTTEILPCNKVSHKIAVAKGAKMPQQVAVTAVNRFGTSSAPGRASID